MGVRATFGPVPTAVPGQVAHVDLLVENPGEAAVTVRIDLAGEVAAWGWVTPPTLVLVPASTGRAMVSVKLPRAALPPPGPLALTTSVTPVDGPGEPVTVTGMLDVAPFVDVAATLRPHTSQGRAAGRHQVVIVNHGNVAVPVTVDGDGEDVGVRADQGGPLQISPGQEISVGIVARLGSRPFRTGTTTRPFDVVVRNPGGSPLATVEGVSEFPAGAAIRRMGAAVVAVAMAAVALGAVLHRGSAGTDAAAPQPGTTVAFSTDCPGRDHLSPDANGIVRPGVKMPFDYSFLFVSQDGCQPARFNPCGPVRYMLNRTQATDADVADLDAALAKVTEATGLQFQFAGTSTEDPRSPARPVRTFDGTFTWPPVLIGWAHLGDGAVLRPPTTTAGQSPPGVVGGGGRPLVSNNVITTGNLVLNLDAVTDTDTRNPVPHGFGPGVNWGRIMMHELAHVIGLGHVESRTSIMNETLTQQTLSSAEWGVGDLIGLRHLGKEAGCVTVPPVQTVPAVQAAGAPPA